VLVASAPTRLDFGGGWTDVPPYPEERGGFVCNLAIDRRATVALHADVDGAADGAADPLLNAALRVNGVHGYVASTRSDFPIGAGLGGSSAAGVAMQAVLAAMRSRSIDSDAERHALAESSRSIEVDEMRFAGGRQDHYAAAFGGALGLTFEATTRVERIPLSTATRVALEEQLTLIYSGESRLSSETITAVLDGYAARAPRIVHALDQMALLARGMRGALIAGDLTTLGHLVDEHWGYQRSLHPRITTDRINAIEAAVRRAGAFGFKALGASGGGCVLAIASATDTPAVRVAAATIGDVLPWRVDLRGVTLESPTPIPATSR
jgi:D-glycero-alpha-D-manno-heptose-7-phosphate kinase